MTRNSGGADEPINPQAKLGFVPRYIFSTDHKIIGIQYFLTGLLFLLLGGVLSLLMSRNPVWPRDAAHLVPMVGQRIGLSGGIIMTFFVIIVMLVGGLGNYLIPPKMGAANMAFPFLGGLALWGVLPGIALIVTGPFLSGNAAPAGWADYPPAAIQTSGSAANDLIPNLLRPAGSNWPMFPIFMQVIAQSLMLGYICWHYIRIGNVNAGRVVGTIISLTGGILLSRLAQRIEFNDQSAWCISLFWLGWSSLIVAINFVTTIIKLRRPGMGRFRVPLSVWSLLIASAIVVLIAPILGIFLLRSLPG